MNKHLSDVQLDKCWLCGKSRLLTYEHVPPRSAFNRKPIRFKQIARQIHENGWLKWEDGVNHTHGHSVKSLCVKCNERAGRKYVPAFAAFVEAIGDQISTVHPGHSITVTKIKKPQLILRQILMQFVSINSAAFAKANPWIRQVLCAQDSQHLPTDVCLYIFATKSRIVRHCGLSGQADAAREKYYIVSEIVHWPLGVVLSFGELPHEGLTPINHWSRIPYASSKEVDICLTVQPVNTPSALDFRSDIQVSLDRLARNVKPVPRKVLQAMADEMTRRMGSEFADRLILVTSPSQLDAFNFKS